MLMMISLYVYVQGWVVAAEVFPQRLRGRGMTLTTLANWLSNFLIARTLPVMILPTSLDLWGTFAMLSGFCILMSTFVMAFLPETKGVDLDHMEWVFRVFLHEPWYKKLHFTSGGLDEDTLAAVMGVDLNKTDKMEDGDLKQTVELNHSNTFGPEIVKSVDESKANSY